MDPETKALKATSAKSDLLHILPHEEPFDDVEVEEVAVDDDGEDDEEAEAAAPVDGLAVGKMEVKSVDEVGVVAGHQDQRQRQLLDELKPGTKLQRFSQVVNIGLLHISPSHSLILPSRPLLISPPPLLLSPILLLLLSHLLLPILKFWLSCLPPSLTWSCSQTQPLPLDHQLLGHHSLLSSCSCYDMSQVFPSSNTWA